MKKNEGKSRLLMKNKTAVPICGEILAQSGEICYTLGKRNGVSVMKPGKKGDLWLVGLLMGTGLILGAVLWLHREPGAQVVVRVDGQLTAGFALSEDTEYSIQGAGGGTNYLIIRQGRAWLDTASCPDKLCVRQGAIRYAGDSIICLPNKVVVEIVGSGDSKDLDAVVK